MSNLPGSGQVITVDGDTPSSEFRSQWTDLRNVAFSVNWIDVNGTRARYIRAGNPTAPKLIMLHGTGGHAEVFAPNFGAFAEHYDCWAIDMVGHGYTDKPDVPYDSFYSAKFIEDFMDTIGAKTADFIAISVGSMHVLRLAQLSPEKVGKMVLVTPFGAPMPEPGQMIHDFWIGKVPPPSDGRDEASREPSFEVAKKILSTVVADINKIPDDMIAARFDTARQPGAANAFKHVMWWMDLDRRLKNTFTVEQLAEIQHKTLAVVGAGDPAFVPNGEGVAKAMPNCGGVIINDASHWPNYEAPETFNKLCAEFLQSQ